MLVPRAHGCTKLEWSRPAAIFALGSVLLTGNLGQASAAEPILLTASPRILTATDQDTFLIPIPPRSKEEVQADREGAEKLRAAEQALLVETIDQEAGTKVKIQVQEAEIEATKAKTKLAKEEKRETDRQTLEGLLNAQESRLRLLEKRADERAAERQLTDAAQGAADALIRYYDVEQELIAMRAARPPQPVVGQDDAALERQLRYERDLWELERKGLEAALLQVEKRQEALKKEEQLLDRRLELFEAQNAAREGKPR